MEIIFDMREKKLYDNCLLLKNTNEKFMNIKFTIQNLNIGDVIIKYLNQEKIIIERKTINDLISSIKDKRYEEQSFRLNELNHPNHNIIYLIEGLIDKFKEKQMIHSSIFSLNYYKGFSVYRTINLNETAFIICNMCLKLHSENNKKKPFYSSHTSLNKIYENDKQKHNEIKDNEQKQEPNMELKKSHEALELFGERSIDPTIFSYGGKEQEQEQEQEQEEDLRSIKKYHESGDFDDERSMDSTLFSYGENKEYCGLITKKKSSYITPNNISEIMLCQIPGINKITAFEILKNFDGNINKLICCLNDNPNIINNLSYTTKTNKIRKINKKNIENILKFLNINKK
jgi:ERCC4-type nuclease